LSTVAFYATHHQFESETTSFLIAPRSQDGLVRLYLGSEETGEPLGEFPSARLAFGAIYAQQTGYQPWDSIEPAHAAAMAMEDSRWRHPRFAHLTDPGDQIVQRDDPEQIPPPEPPHI
jgi:hypothetical protein